MTLTPRPLVLAAACAAACLFGGCGAPPERAGPPDEAEVAARAPSGVDPGFDPGAGAVPDVTVVPDLPGSAAGRLASEQAALAAELGTPPEDLAELIRWREETREARCAWWRRDRFGMFIHWGVYAVPAGTWKGKRIGGIGEWIMNRARIPAGEYEKLAERFNPVKFDADEWVRLAKDAGQKYIVITSKHHDGFAMYHSKASGYNIVDATPFDRDPLKELAEACRKHGIRLGFYYSQAQDWHHPGGSGNTWDKEMKRVSMERYIEVKAAPQVREILSNYGNIAILWWDTPRGMSKERAEMLFPLTRLQPGIITNNRLGGGYRGDYGTPEQHIPGRKSKLTWETCMTMNGTWGYKSYDEKWKSTEALIRNLVDIVSKDGNYLLNVGPTAEGEIPEPSVKRLREIGKWLRVNGESIYGCGAGGFGPLPWGRVTAKPGSLRPAPPGARRKRPGRLYLHVFEWPEGGKLELQGLKNEVGKAWLVADPGRRALEVRARDGVVAIDLPGEAPDAIDTVVALEIEGEPEVEPHRVTEKAGGVLVLAAEDAEVHGSNARYEKRGRRGNIGYWSSAKDWVQWRFKLARPGRFDVQIRYACDAGSAESTYEVVVGSEKLRGKVTATGGWDDYVTVKLGTVEVDAAKGSLAVRPLSKPGLAVMNLKTITLRRAKE